MNRSAKVQSGHPSVVPIEPSHDWLDDDPRLRLARRVVAGRHFANSPLMSKFLLYVVTETLEGRQSRITEHHIGVHVFGRSPGYRTDEDNIVRNYARQVRKRLAEYFANEGRNDPMYIEIPLGGYVPVFKDTMERKSDTKINVKFDEEKLPGPQPAAAVETPPTSPFASLLRLASSLRLSGRHIVGSALLLAAYSAGLICFTWLAASRVHASRQVAEPTQMLWKAMLDSSNDTYIVPADVGFNLLEDMSHHPVSLADYIKGSYLELPLPRLDDHSAEDLRTQQFTGFVDLQIVAALARQQEYNPQRVFLRFPRDLRLDDLKNSNVVIIGSVSSNPWASIAASSTNFRIVLNDGMQGAAIVNMKPQLGEAASYASHWNEPAHETYAVIAYLPNLSGSGHLLLLAGLDVAATQGAAEAVLHSNAIVPILDRAKRPDGSLRPFEILLRSTSIQSNATGTQVIASRIY